MSRVAWRVTGGGAAGVVVSVAFWQVAEHPVWYVAWITLAVLSGLVFAGAAMTVADRGGFWMATLVILVGSAPPLAIAVGVHNAVLISHGTVEKCRVVQKEEYERQGRRRHGRAIHYVIACPSGPVEESEDYHRRLTSDEVDVYHLPPLRPELVRNVHHEPRLLWGGVAVMVLFPAFCFAIRRRDTRQPSRV